MKTSSKILLTTFLVIIVIIIIILSIIRTNMYTEIDTIVGNKLIKEEIRQVENFQKINASNGLIITIKQDNYQEVKVIADENIIDKIETNSIYGTLKITTRSKIKNAKKKNVYIVIDTLSQIKAKQGVIINTENTIAGDKLSLSLEAGSIGDLSLEYNELRANFTAGAVTTIDGKVNSSRINCSAGAILNGEYLNGDYIDIQASAGSVVKVGTFEAFNGSANSGAVIKYDRQTKIVNTNSNSGGRIKSH